MKKRFLWLYMTAHPFTMLLHPPLCSGWSSVSFSKGLYMPLPLSTSNGSFLWSGESNNSQTMPPLPFAGPATALEPVRGHTS